MTAAARILGVIAVIVGFVATTATAGILGAVILGTLEADVALAAATLAVGLAVTFVGARAAFGPLERP